MPRSINILVRFLFGTDVTIGMFAFAAVTLSLSVHAQWNIALLSIAFAILPDIDMLPYLMVRKNLAYRSHWLVGHHPIVMVPAYSALGFYIGSFTNDQAYVGMLAAVNAIAHFAHDSIQPQGLHWLSPFSWTRYRLQDLALKKVPLEVWSPIMKSKGSSNDSIAREFSSRSAPIDAWHLSAWWVGFSLVCTLLTLR